MDSTLYKRDVFLNKEIPHIFNKEIYEYDMHHAGISISRELNLLPDDVLDKIEERAKNKKEIAISLGKIQKKDNNYKEGLKNGFEEIRRRFFESNELEDFNILSIKKDAIFTLIPCKNLIFGKVVFSLKHKYTSYMYTGSYELYYNINELEVKGLDDLQLFHHENHVTEFLKRVFYKMEEEGKESALRYVKVMSDRYKRLELDPGFYRDFNHASNYRSKDGEFIYSDITSLLLPSIDISYNYQNVILPVIKAIL